MYPGASVANYGKVNHSPPLGPQTHNSNAAITITKFSLLLRKYSQGIAEQNCLYGSLLFFMSSIFSGAIEQPYSKQSAMPVVSLYDSRGSRKYLTSQERRAFAAAALQMAPPILTFCLTLLYTGARVSELLALTPERIDRANSAIIFETLKRRRRGVFRAIPVPPELVTRVMRIPDIQARRLEEKQEQARIWNWGRTTAWKHVKAVMRAAGIQASLATPKACRHAFGVNAIQSGVALNILQRWMGHARIETTAIYADVLGKEERALAQRTWTALRNLPL